MHLKETVVSLVSRCTSIFLTEVLIILVLRIGNSMVNNVDPNQAPRSMGCDQGLHFVRAYLFGNLVIDQLCFAMFLYK